MFVSIVPPEHVLTHVVRVMELLNKAKKYLHPYLRPGDVMTEILAGDFTLWGVFDEEHEQPLRAILVTRIVNYWRARCLELIVLAGDDMNEWLGELNSVTSSYARDLHCTLRLIPGGRKGWVRALKQLGWTESNSVKLESYIV